MLFVQVCFICSVLFVAWSMSALLTKTGHGMMVEGHPDLEHWGRRLMASAPDNETEQKNCSEPAIHEFPDDFFTNDERKSGAIMLHIVAALYMFLALAITCDEYFVTSLEKICEKLDLSEDVAGATFMAAGSSAPELFASIIGVFITHGDVGVGTIVGSAVFNILCIIGVCGIFAGQVCVCLCVFGLSSICCRFNSSMQKFFMGKSKKNVANGNAAASSEMEDVKPTKAYSRGSVVMVDEIINASPSKFRFPEAGLRVMVTSHFGPKTRLRMASRLIITERQKLVQAANGVETQVIDGKVEIENGNVPEDKPTEAEENDTISPFHIPNYYFCWCMNLTCFFSCKQIILFLSPDTCVYFSQVTIIGYTLGIPDVIMGITFLAAGTSVPDCIASLIVARQGLGDMAVSNTIGSNVFDILVGLGVPWAIQTMCVSYGSEVMINSRGLVYSVVLLLGSVALTVLGIHLNKWRLDVKLGAYVLVLYAVFLCFSIMIEYNVFTFVNLAHVHRGLEHSSMSRIPKPQCSHSNPKLFFFSFFFPLQ
uniref:Solute carrier family 24 member 4 n=1 Tax=Lates calcarifer TaxID=8187 RepID=A0A4W6EGD6_LATCA